MSIAIQNAIEAFQKQYGCAPTLAARAPGRVNIIGEHTDYNDGFVLPMAIEHDTVVAGLPRKDTVLRMRAENLGRTAEADTTRPRRSEQEPWTDYIMGVIDELQKLGVTVSGADLVILGDVPVGCGLSSSAALEMAALAFFEQIAGVSLEDAEAARLGQRVENHFLGLSTGIMDQFISRSGRKNHALFLDCRTYAYDLVPVAFDDALFVIANTACPRGLTASKYNERVQECAQAVETLAARNGGAGAKLRDFTMADLLAAKDSLEDVPFRRARHVITENDRTLAAREAMKAGDAAKLGELMNGSDDSLRLDYEVTSRELDILTRIARSLPGCYGARMTGAGFGGCTVNLVRQDAVEAFCAELLHHYNAETGITGEVYISAPAQGAGCLAF